VVFGTSPTLVTPTLGAALATSINGLAITSSTGTFTLTNLKTFAVQNTITLAGTDSTTITLPATTGTVALNNQTFFLGSTSIAINRATASQSLTGITSIDGYAAGLAGGNATTLLGSLPYQSAANTTTLLGPNTTATKKFLRMTGDGTNGAAPAWDTLVSSDIPAFNLGTTSITFNRSSATQSLTGVNIDGSAGSATKATNLVGGNNTTLLGSIGYQSNTDTTTLLSPNTTATKNFLTQTGNGTNGASPAWGTLAAGDIPSFNLGTTSITFNRSSATQSLTGINIDGSAGSATKATNIIGGNNTTLLGALHYQSNTDTTSLLSPNTTTTLAVLTQTGNGTNGAAPVWTTSTGTGSVVLGTNPSLYAPSFQTSPYYNTVSNNADADVTFDASQYQAISWYNSFTANHALNVSNLTTGRTFTVWIRNTNASSRTITINASNSTTAFSTVNLAVGGGVASSTTVTLAATSGTAMVILWNMGGNLVGMVN
jgi:hypothetical protein